MLFSAVMLLVSCLGDDTTEVTLYDDAAITSFGISTANIHIVTPDTAYWETSTDVADYPFQIDQAAGTISNRDSLPIGTDVTKLLVTYSTKNSSVAGIMPTTTTERDSLRYLLTTDSLDFSQPRLVSVYATDGSFYRDYTVTVNVHKEYGDTCYWSTPTVNASIAAMEKAKAVRLGEDVYVIGTDGVSTTIVRWNRDYPSQAATLSTPLGVDAYKNVAVYGDKLYFLDNGELKATADGETFAKVDGDASGLKQLVGASSTEIYALGTGGSLLASTDGGATWNIDNLDDSETLLPTEDIASVCTTYKYAENSEYMLLGGNRDASAYADDTNAMMWRKIVYGEGNIDTPKWVYIEFDDTNYYPLARLASLSMMTYGTSVLAIGKGASGYAAILESRDSGITWKENTLIGFPADFDGANTDYAIATTDSQNMIWLVKLDTGEIWKGRQNKMGWTE